jgi:hypothetical protein
MEAKVAPYQGEIESLLTTAASAVVAAEQALAPRTLAVGYANEDRVSFNRRLKRRDGSTQMNWEALQRLALIRKQWPRLGALSILKWRAW